MGEIRRVDDERSASALADLLNGHSRRLPVVIVTIPAGRTEPWIDVKEIAKEAGDLAEVYLMQTGPFTWEFSHRMAEGTQVYGGAGRVYPVGHGWISDLTKAPLHFAFNDLDGRRATQDLISDTLRMAAAVGLPQTVTARARRRVSGVVTATIAGRAWVDIGHPAVIAEELTVADVPIDRLVGKRQRVEGWYDAATRRIDVTASLRPAAEALASYSVGDVVLTRVATVEDHRAGLVLYPKTTVPAVTVAVRREDVTTNPFDELSALMTVGEVIPARVVSVGPRWALGLADVDDDEPIVEAPPLLPGGPPWLVEEEPEPEPEALEPPPVVLPMPTPAPVRTQPVEPEAPPAPAAFRPTPAMLDRNRLRAGAVPAPAVPVPAAPAAAAPAAQAPQATPTKTLLLTIDGLKAELAAAKREHEALGTQLRAGGDEREQLRYLLDQAERRANRAENDLKAARIRLRKAGSTRVAPSYAEGPRFADREQGFRYLVLTQWAKRTLPSEQAERPLPEYVLGPEFLDSLDRLEGIKPEKVADVAFEIVTGLAPSVPSREVHRLRTGLGGDDPVRVRKDGAAAWRASLQVNTPSARRIHYWVLPNGQVEFARVATHDDYDA